MSLSVVTKPPYEVTETGWGEFEVVIKIYFNDTNERPVRNYFDISVWVPAWKKSPNTHHDPNHEIVIFGNWVNNFSAPWLEYKNIPVG